MNCGGIAIPEIPGIGVDAAGAYGRRTYKRYINAQAAGWGREAYHRERVNGNVLHRGILTTFV